MLEFLSVFNPKKRRWIVFFFPQLVFVSWASGKVAALRVFRMNAEWHLNHKRSNVT